MGKLDQKIAIVTGSGQGLGLEIAKRFVEEGAIVCLNDLDRNRLEQAEEALRTQGYEVMSYQADVAESSEVNTMVEEVVRKYGRLDICVNNAGFGKLAEAWEETDDDWDRLIQVNLTGIYYCIRAALKPMMKQRSGKIVNMSSVCGRVGRPFVSPGYSAAKAGVVGLTMSVAQSVASYGIQVNAIAPGPIRTEFQSAFPEDKMKVLRANFPLGWGTPKAIADGVLYLASDSADWHTGFVLDINGGHLMG
jgi:3-oxoacyl-[acyl-carrier protein] reductase